VDGIRDRVSSAAQIVQLCADLERVLNKRPIHAEDVERRMELLRPLNDALTSYPEPPIGGTEATVVALLLWSKTHPKDAPLDSIIEQLENPSEMVRVTALEALVSTINARHKKWLDTNFLFRVKQLANSLLGKESSPVLRQLLSELKNAAEAQTRTKTSSVPLASKNPYVAGNPVRDPASFFGREDVLEEIRSAFENGTKSVILHGARRTGKTSLLYRIADGALGSKYTPIYIDMQFLAGRGTEEFYRHLVEALTTAVRQQRESRLDQLDPSPLQNKDNLAPYVSDFIAWALIQLQPKALVLMLDEYEYLQTFLEHSDLKAQLLHLVESKSDLYFVLAGARKLETLEDNSLLSLVDASKYIKISFLTREESLRLVTQGGRGLAVYEQGVPEQIVNLTGGHPFYTQLFCQMLFDLRDPTGRITREQVDQAMDDFLVRPSPHLVLSWKALPFDDRIVASALAALEGARQDVVSAQECLKYFRAEKVPLGIGRQECQQAINALRDLDLIEKPPRRDGYRFTVGLVCRWIAENYSVWDLLEEYRNQVTSTLSSAGRREWARIIDAIVALLVIVPLLSAFMFSLGAFIGGFVWILLLGVFSAIFRGTPGVKLLGLRLVNEIGSQQPRLRTFEYGLFSALPVGLILLAAWVVERRDIAAAILAGAAIVLVGLNTVMIHFGKRRQTLWDKLTHTLVVRGRKGRNAR
jgi:hypothetical protein